MTLQATNKNQGETQNKIRFCTFEQILQTRNRLLVRGNLFGGRLVFELQLLDLPARQSELVGQLRECDRQCDRQCDIDDAVRVGHWTDGGQR
jgi:hypothetical protein